MPQLEDSIVLILSSDEKNTAFGTGFIIARDQNYSYLLTCAHVVEQINGKNQAENQLKISGLDAPVDIVACGASDGIDMALLKVAGLFDKPLFGQFMQGQEKADIKVTGYSLFDYKNGQHLQRKLKGTVSHRVKIAANNQEYPFLDIAIQDDDFAKLEGGYSGSPLYNSSGHVLGVVSHKRTGEMGHAFCISNLAVLYPEIYSLLPTFNRQIDKISRITKILTLLLGRKTEIEIIYQKLGKCLNQIKNDDIDNKAEIILQCCESFLNNEPNATKKLIDVIQYLETEIKQPNYSSLADSLKKGRVCFCLGTELPKLFDPSLNSAQELAHTIATLAEFEHKNANRLAEIFEYAQLRSTLTPRHRVVNALKQLITPTHQPKIELYELMLRIEEPFLVIATGFDILLEQSLNKSGHSFVSIVINQEAKTPKERYLLKWFNPSKQSKNPGCCSGDDLSKLQLMENGYSIIFYLRGYLGSDESPDNLLLSERDYFNQAKELLTKSYPTYLNTKLKNKELWFLGYQPDGWETRLIAKVLQQQRGYDNNSSKPLVIQAHPDSFEQLFWEEMNCSHYPDLTVTDFVAQIKASL